MQKGNTLFNSVVDENASLLLQGLEKIEKAIGTRLRCILSTGQYGEEREFSSDELKGTPTSITFIRGDVIQSLLNRIKIFQERHPENTSAVKFLKEHLEDETMLQKKVSSILWDAFEKSTKNNTLVSGGSVHQITFSSLSEMEDTFVNWFNPHNFRISVSKLNRSISIDTGGSISELRGIGKYVTDKDDN